MPDKQCSEGQKEMKDFTATGSYSTSKLSLKSGGLSSSDKVCHRPRSFAFWRRSCYSVSEGHSPYSIYVTLHCGINLASRDKCGLSDPFVKFKFGGRTLAKSKVMEKTLNPQWNENFLFHIVGDFEQPLIIKVYDKDRLLNDYMGCARFNLSQLILDEMLTMELHLHDETGKATEAYLGAIRLTFMLTHRNLSGVSNAKPTTSTNQSSACNSPTPSPTVPSVSKISSTASISRISEAGKTSWQQQPFLALSRSPFFQHRTHCAMVFVHVIEGTALLSMDDNGLSDPFVKFRLQPNQKYKTKVCKATLQPRWLEYFEFKLYSESEAFLELSVWDHDVAEKNDFMGRARLDLKSLAQEKTHIINQELEDNAGFITLMVTISGATEETSATDLYFSQRGRQDIVNRYGLLKTTEALDDIGWCRVKILRAKDLPRDAEVFCVLELVNTRLQTHTVRKCQGCPQWDKAFIFNVTDLHSNLEISLVDQRNSSAKTERRAICRSGAVDETVFRESTAPLVGGRLIGRLVIPLLKLRNGQHRWYALKDKNLVRRQPGALLIQVDLIFNPIRAAIKTLHPRERRYMKPDVKFKIQTMRRNVDRFVRLVEDGLYFGTFISSLWSWQNHFRSSIAFLLYLLIVWNFEVYMLPLTLVMLLIATKLYHSLHAYFVGRQRIDSISEESNTSLLSDYSDEENADSDIEDKDESNVGLMYKIRQIQTYLVLVQQYLHSASSTLERIRNTFRWSVPWLSWFLLLLMLLATLLLYALPLRWIFILWGANKFTKNLLRPTALDNNELADFLSRVPSDVDLMETRDLKPLSQSNEKR